MRYLVKYTKESHIKFISHLDLMRTIHKVVTRTELPVHYSKGFHPHMAVAIAQPLGVGVYSSGEYMDLILDEEVAEEEIIDRLNSKTASGIKFIKAKKIVEVEGVKKLPQSMALIDGCRYTVKIVYSDVTKLEEQMTALFEKEEWNTIKKSKKCEREVDLKTLIHEIKFWLMGNELILNMLITSGSREHLSADLVVSYIKENTTSVDEEAFVDIKREEIYCLRDEKLVPLYECR